MPGGWPVESLEKKRGTPHTQRTNNRTGDSHSGTQRRGSITIAARRLDDPRCRLISQFSLLGYQLAVDHSLAGRQTLHAVAAVDTEETAAVNEVEPKVTVTIATAA